MKKRKFFSNSGILKWKMPLLISILFWMSLSGTAEAEVQLRSISLRLENVSLSEALSRIEEASGYSFFYDENKIDLSRQVSVNAQNKAVKDILKNILFSTGMTTTKLSWFRKRKQPQRKFPWLSYSNKHI